MSAEVQEQVSEPEAASITPPSPPKATAEDALTKLEGHRCAICQNILINACRIDCGHTFCRHCLNVDKDDRLGGEKPTCFICDAAITEIRNTTDRDKEIDKLYTVLSTDERLSRERDKSERKELETNFVKRPKQEKSVDSDRNSNGSSGSGDATYTTMPDNLDRACWRDYGHDDNDEENLSENDDTPMYFCGSYTVWSDEHGSEECHHVHGGEDYDEGEESGSEEAVEASGYANSPFPQPIVIHHTVQHIYHTVDSGERTGSESSGESGRHREVNPEWRGPDHAYPPRYRNYGNPRRPTAYQDYSFHNHYRNPGPTYASAGYYAHHYSNAPSPSFGHTSAYPAQPAHGYYTNHETYPQMRATMYAGEREGYSPHDEHYCGGHHDHHNSDEDNEAGLEECCACESLCEFHRAMRDGEESSMLYAEARSPQSLSQRSSHNRIAFEESEDNGESTNYYDQDPEDEQQELFTFNVTIPISVAENLALRRESFERSSRTVGDSKQVNARRKR